MAWGRRPTAITVLGAILAAALVWMGRPGTRGTTESATFARDGVGDEAEPVLQGRGHRADEASGTDAERRDEEDDVPWPSIPVRVVDEAGNPVPRRTVHAYEVGEEHPDPSPRGEPWADTDETGLARLRVPVAGRYDVWVAFAPRVPSVTIPSTAQVRIALPRGEDVTVVADPDVPLPRKSVPCSLSCVDADGAGVSGSVNLSAKRRQGTWSGMPSGFDYEIGDLLPGVRAIPRIVRPPARVRLVYEYPILVHVLADTPPYDGRVPRPGSYVAHVRLTWDRTVDEAAQAITVYADEKGVFSSIGCSVRLVSPEGTVRWGGDGVEPGSLDFHDLERGKENILRLPIQLRGPVSTPSTPPARKQSFEVVPSRDVSMPEMLTFESSHAVWNRKVPPGSDRFEDECLDQDDWVIARVDAEPELVAGPRRIGVGDGPSLVLQRGGFLVLSVGRIPPAGLGRFTIARADGAPFPCWSERDCAVELPIERDLVLGPFEPGAIEWRVRLGGKDMAHLSSVVRAGERLPLVVPALRPAP